MTIMTLAEESKRQGGFYVPGFEVHIEGARLPQDVLRDVIQITYKDGIKEIDSFELTVNNWDSSIKSFKYVGSETPRSLKENPLHRLFEPCRKEVKVLMGYMGDLRVMVTGHFTSMKPNFPSSGASTLTVLGLNVLHRLRNGQRTTTWKNKTDSEIARQIGTLHDQNGKKRFPFPIDIDETAKNHEPELEYLTQNNQYDIDFLFGRTRERGYVVFVQEADKKVRGSKSRLYFGPSDGAKIPGLRDVTFKLEWGKSLIDFKPLLSTARQVQSVTVHHWDRRTRQPIKEKVTLQDSRFDCNRDLYELLQGCDLQEEIITDEPVFTRKQARERAFAILSDRLKELVTVSGTSIGLPDLRAGQRVQIDGLGARFNGMYFITDTTHEIGDGGYITRFNARRENCK